MLHILAEPPSWIPYVHIGFIKDYLFVDWRFGVFACLSLLVEKCVKRSVTLVLLNEYEGPCQTFIEN